MRFRLLFLAIIAIVLNGCSRTPGPGRQVLVSEGLENRVVDSYWLYLPPNHHAQANWPVILFLQGGYGASQDPRTSKNDGPSKFALQALKDLSQPSLVRDTFIIINPHMRLGAREERQWFQYPVSLNQIVEEVIQKYSGDPSRIYLTGLSRGGVGSWELAKRFPGKYAAMLTVAGPISCRNDCENLANLPLWIIHNREDHTVESSHALDAVNYLEQELVGKAFIRTNGVQLAQEQLEVNRILTIFEREGHDAWNQAYRTPQIYQWLLTKKISY